MIATIFDINGTLVESFGFDDACYISEIREVLEKLNPSEKKSVRNSSSSEGDVSDTIVFSLFPQDAFYSKA